MSKYGCVAIIATEKSRKGVDPRIAWDESACEIFSDNKASVQKSCPKSAFLGLAEEGLILGVSPGNYTKSVKNKRYAIAALSILKCPPQVLITPDFLWESVMEAEVKAHNQQMDVVMALWNEGCVEKK